MKPTYSIAEIRIMIGTLEIPELDVLSDLVAEEATGYEPAEIKEIKSLVSMTRTQLSNHELQLEYLLSFN